MTNCKLYVHDLNLPQLRLATLSLLGARARDFATHFGIKCSSLCQINAGTSRRAPCCSTGFTEYQSVRISNILVERTVWVNKVRWFSSALKRLEGDQLSPHSYPNLYTTWCFHFPIANIFGSHLCIHKANPSGPPCRMCALVLLCTALGGTWTIEQPLGSVLEFYPVFRKMMQSIYKCGGIHAVPPLQKFYFLGSGLVWDAYD